MTDNVFDKGKILPLLEQCLESQPAIELINLATCDGFNVCAAIKNGLHRDIELDKMAAATSTLHSVSDAVAKQILNKRFDITFIETGAGNIAFVSMEINGNSFVLSISAGMDLNIASLRFTIKRLRDECYQIEL